LFDELVVGADPPVWIEDQELETDTSLFATAIDITISELTLEAFLPSERSPRRIFRQQCPASRRRDSHLREGPADPPVVDGFAWEE
jgi:hypothetical protein